MRWKPMRGIPTMDQILLTRLRVVPLIFQSLVIALSSWDYRVADLYVN